MAEPRRKTLCLAIIQAALEKFPDLQLTVMESAEELEGNVLSAAEITNKKGTFFFPPVLGKIRLKYNNDVPHNTDASSPPIYSFDPQFNTFRELNSFTIPSKVVVSLTGPTWTANLQVMGKTIEECSVATVNDDVWYVSETFISILTKLNDRANYKICAGFTETEISEIKLPGFVSSVFVSSYPGGAQRFESPTCERLFKTDPTEKLPNQPFSRCKNCKKWYSSKLYETKVKKEIKTPGEPLSTSPKLQPRSAKRRIYNLKKSRDALKRRLNKLEKKINKYKVQLNGEQSKEMSEVVSVINKEIKSEA